jgi:hypothetical protein
MTVGKKAVSVTPGSYWCIPLLQAPFLPAGRVVQSGCRDIDAIVFISLFIAGD